MIYFIRLGQGGPIKIGTTDNVRWRVDQLATLYRLGPGQLAILRLEQGGRDDEREMHSRFARLRFGQSEQFMPGPELADYVGIPREPHWQAIRRLPQYRSPNSTVCVAMERSKVETLKRISERQATRTLAGFAMQQLVLYARAREKSENPNGTVLTS